MRNIIGVENAVLVENPETGKEEYIVPEELSPEEMEAYEEELLMHKLMPLLYSTRDRVAAEGFKEHEFILRALDRAETLMAD